MTAIEFLQHIGGTDTYYADNMARGKNYDSGMRLAKRRYQTYQGAYAELTLCGLLGMTVLDKSNSSAVWAAARDRDAGREQVRCEELEG